jgi:hypothetical protein
MLMTTQTLEGPQTGAGEQQTASEEMPAENKLQEALDDYQIAMLELEELSGKVVRAQADADMIGDNHSLSEAESLRAISDSQGRKALYTGRIAAFERKLAGLLAALKSELADAMRTQTNTVRQLVERERERVIDAVYAALGVTNNVFGRGEIVRLTRLSPSIHALERLLPGNMYGVPKWTPEAVLAETERVLRNAEKLEEI